MEILELKPVMCAHTYSNVYMYVISDSPFSMKEESIKWLFCSIRTNYHSTSIDIHKDGARAKTGGYRGIRGDRRIQRRGGYPMETSCHFIQQNNKNIS